MLYSLACLALLVYFVYLICDGVLYSSGWTDPRERKAATFAVMTAAVLNSDKKPKTK